MACFPAAFYTVSNLAWSPFSPLSLRFLSLHFAVSCYDISLCPVRYMYACAFYASSWLILWGLDAAISIDFAARCPASAIVVPDPAAFLSRFFTPHEICNTWCFATLFRLTFRFLHLFTCSVRCIFYLTATLSRISTAYPSAAILALISALIARLFAACHCVDARLRVLYSHVIRLSWRLWFHYS